MEQFWITELEDARGYIKDRMAFKSGGRNSHTAGLVENRLR